MGGSVRLRADQAIEYIGRLVEPPQLAERRTKQQPGLERGSQLQRRASQPHGQRRVEHLAGSVRGPRQQPGVCGACTPNSECLSGSSSSRGIGPSLSKDTTAGGGCSPVRIVNSTAAAPEVAS